MALKPNTWDARLLASHYGGRLGGGCPAEAPQPGVSSLGSDGQCINPARHAGQKQGERSSPRQTAGAPANTVQTELEQRCLTSEGHSFLPGLLCPLLHCPASDKKAFPDAQSLSPEASGRCTHSTKMRETKIELLELGGSDCNLEAVRPVPACSSGTLRDSSSGFGRD